MQELKTKQYISLQGVNKERVAQLQLKDLTLQFVGYSKQPLGLGVLEGNKFLITIRNLDKEFSLPSLPETFLVPNYFDEQRFSRNNKPVGLFILQRKFDLAVARVLKYDDDYRIILQEHLEKHERDFVGALRKLPRRSLLFYVHAVQSFFFNEILREQLISKIPDARLIDYSEGVFAFPKEPFMSNPLPDLPLPGFFLTDKLSEEILVKHDLTKDSFILRQIPELSLEGQNRAACMSVMDFKADSLEDDELHENKKKIKISFSLTKGSYATVVIRQVIAAIKPN